MAALKVYWTRKARMPREKESGQWTTSPAKPLNRQAGQQQWQQQSETAPAAAETALKEVYSAEPSSQFVVIYNVQCHCHRRDCDMLKGVRQRKTNASWFHLEVEPTKQSKRNRRNAVRKHCRRGNPDIGLKTLFKMFFNLSTGIYFIYFHPKWFIIF